MLLKFFLAIVHILGICCWEVELNPKEVYRAAEAKLNLICSVNDSKAKITWLVNGSKIVDTILYIKPEADSLYRHVIENFKDRSNVRSFLSFNRMRREFAGNYTCVAEVDGVTKTASSKVSVYVPIIFVDGSELQSADLGSKALIRCNAIATPDPFVTWYKKDEHGDYKVFESNERVYVDTYGLEILNVIMDDEGDYKCRFTVIERGSFKVMNITFKVNTAAKITKPSNNQSVRIMKGDKLKFPCEATGTPAPELLWFHEDDYASSGPFLEFDPVTEEHRRVYTCRAYTEGNYITQNLTVIVETVPKITEFKVLMSDIKEGDEVRLICQAIALPLPRIVIESSNQMKIINSTYEQLSVDSAQLVATIKNVSVIDIGTYTCRASNEHDEAVLNTHLQVEFSPRILSPAGYIGNESRISVYSEWNKDFNITCFVNAYPPPVFTWKMSGIEIHSNEKFKIINSNNASALMFKTTDSTYFTDYECISRNTRGSDRRNFILKKVRVPLKPRLTVVKLTATTIKFHIENAQKIDGGQRLLNIVVRFIKVGHSWSDSFNKTQPFRDIFYVGDLQPGSEYYFRFAAVNNIGMGEWSKEYLIRMPEVSRPEAPSFLFENSTIVHNNTLIANGTGDSYTFHWSVGAHNGGDIHRVHIDYFKVVNRTSDWSSNSSEMTSQLIRSHVIKYPTNEHTHTIDALSLHSYYRIQLRTENMQGTSDPAQVYIYTGDAVREVGQSDGFESDPSHSTALIIVAAVVCLIFISLMLDIVCCLSCKRGLLFIRCASVCFGSSHKRNSANNNSDIAQEIQPLKKQNGQNRHIKRTTSV